MKKYLILLIIGAFLGVLAYAFYLWHDHNKSNTKERSVHVEDYSDYAVATFAGGCFWCTESDFEKTDGVVEVISGYTGGTTKNPTYNDVSSGTTGHRESVRVYYDPAVVSYNQLLDVFWRLHDPTDAGGSFVDRGKQYSSAIFYHDDAQRLAAEMSKEALATSDIFAVPIATDILPVATFYPAEDYHQDYYKKNPRRYKYYRHNSGRDDYIKKTWGDALQRAQHHRNQPQKATHNNNKKLFMTDYKNFTKPSKKQLKEKLSKLQYTVTQKEGTERPFDNAYWDNHDEGIYVDIISGEPLYSSTDKFDSGTGWPSFLKTIKPDVVTKRDDYKLFVKRTELRSKIADSHLGHIILDGPQSNHYIRHCINSASLRFIPKERLEAEGYGEFVSLFHQKN